MSEPSPPEKRNARKRPATDAAEDLETSLTPRRAGRGAAAARRGVKASDEDGSSKLGTDSPRGAKNSPREALNTKDAKNTAEEMPSDAVSVETSGNDAKKTEPIVETSIARSGAAQSAASSTNRFSPASTTTSTPRASKASKSDTKESTIDERIEEMYNTMTSRRFLPFKTKKSNATSQSSSTIPNDLEIAEVIREVVDIVEEHAAEEVLEVTFPNFETIATSRKGYVHELYKVMSI